MSAVADSTVESLLLSNSSPQNLDFPKMSFEELRKRARQLENEIDVKLVAFSKLAASYGSVNKPSETDADTAPLLSGDQKYETMCLELEHQLNTLSDINEKMNGLSLNSSFATIHTVQRHKDILQDYTNEFRRTNNTIKSRKEREQLLSGSRGNGLVTGVSRRDMYLKESDQLAGSERMVEDQISVALETRDHLRSQRLTLKMIQTKVNDLSHRFPVLNALLAKIGLRRRRDALILGTVIGLCLTFLLWWGLA